MLKPLLIEIGVEELPAVPLLKELKNIEKKYAKTLEEYSLLGEFEFYYTPRRLVIWHREFKVAQEDSVEEFFGAPLAVAYKDGVATPAANGFAKKCGVSLEELSSTQKKGKEILYYKKDVVGRSAIDLLMASRRRIVRKASPARSQGSRRGAASASRPNAVRIASVRIPMAKAAAR